MPCTPADSDTSARADGTGVATARASRAAPGDLTD